MSEQFVLSQQKTKGIKVTKVFDEIRWSGTIRSLKQIISNWKEFEKLEHFKLQGRKKMCQELVHLLDPFLIFQTSMQDRSQPLQVICLLTLFTMWDTLQGPSRYTNIKVLQLQSDILIAMKKRHYVRYTADYKGDLGLEKCLFMSPQFKKMSVIRFFLLRCGYFVSEYDAEVHFKKMRKKIMYEILNLAAQVAALLHPNASLNGNNWHNATAHLVTSGFMDPLFQTRRGDMIDQMMEMEMFDREDLEGVDVEQDVMLNDIFVQMSWNELYRYMKQDFTLLTEMSCELTFWNQQKDNLPIMSEVSRIVFSLPVASSPLENDYSVASQILTRQRSKLSMEFFEMELFVSRAVCKREMNIYNVSELSDDERQKLIQQYIFEWRSLKEVMVSFK